MDKFFDTASIRDSYDVVVIGSGPAGCTAALYTARDEFSTLVLEKKMIGGQMGITSHIENHPGIADGITGAELAHRYYTQATHFGATIRYGNCTDIQVTSDCAKMLFIEGREKPIKAKTVIIASGCIPNSLRIPGESKFFGKGVSTCATCDGGFYKGKTVVTVGGGNTALNESIYLTRFAEKVYLVHRRDEFRGTKVCQTSALKNPKIEMMLNSTVAEIHGDTKVTGVTIQNLKNNSTQLVDTDGVFVFVGQQAQIEPFDKILQTDDNGFIITDEYMQTSIAGIFAAGDIRSKEFRQIAIATGEAVTAAQMAAKYLQEFCSE